MTKMQEIFERQGLDGSQGYEEAKAARRNKNVAAAHEVLTRNEITYREDSSGVFEVKADDGRTIAYYPPTGEWVDRGHTGYGVRKLVRHLKGEVK